MMFMCNLSIKSNNVEATALSEHYVPIAVITIVFSLYELQLLMNKRINYDYMS